MTSFVRDDVELLGERYDVRTFAFEAGRPSDRYGHARAVLRGWATQRAWLREEAPRAAAILTWFADYHAVLPVRAGRRFGVPTAVVLGGFDTTCLPALGYGVFASRWRAPLARYALCRADLLLPVAEALIASENAFATWPTPTRQGIRAHAPRCTTPCAVVPTGYDPAAWPMGPAERGATVCTVAFVGSERTLQLKGIDLVFAVAEQMPDVSFSVVGVDTGFQEVLMRRFSVTENVRLLPPRPREALAEVYAGHAVYVQLSRSEGLPNVLCEAMLCGCIPVGSAVGGIPEIIGETGYVVDVPQPAAIAAGIRKALGAGPEARRAARERITGRYTLARRKEALHSVFHAREDARSNVPA
jgi:glycosyltransferase involved in cell wall biosynthesis